MSDDRLLIGTDRRGRHRKQYIDQADLNIHTHILGRSGVGKSWLMKHMIKTDIDNNIKGGPGLCLIDPDGDVFDYALSYVARNPLAQHRLLIIDTLRTDWAVGLNYLEYDQERMSSSSHAGVVMRGIAKAFGDEDAEAMPRLQRWERDALIPLIEAGLTLGELFRFLTNEAFRHLVLAMLPKGKLSTRPLTAEWQLFNEARLSDKLNLTDSVLNRANKFALSDYALSVFGQQHSTIDFREAMDQRKIILCRLAEGKLSREEIRLVGVTIVDKIVQAALSRVDQKEEERIPFRFYIDEFAQFVCDDIAEGLDRLRKYKVSMVLAHQRLEQLRHESLNVYSAVMTNCHVKIAFAMSREDAEIMAKELFGAELYRNRIKRILEQTKFWPEEEERIIRARGSAHTSMSSDMEMEATSEASGASHGSTEHSGASLLYPGEISIFAPEVTATTLAEGAGTSQLYTSMTGSSRGRGRSYGDAYTESESTAIVPFYKLIPFKEVSSIQDWSIEEKLERFIAWIMGQDNRMAQVKVGANARSFPILTPELKDPATVPAMVEVTVNHALTKNNSERPLLEVTQQINDRALYWDKQEELIELGKPKGNRRRRTIKVPSAKQRKSKIQDKE